MIFDVVDQIYCIVYKPYKEERYNDLCKEIDRLNLKVKIMEFEKHYTTYYDQYKLQHSCNTSCKVLI